MFTPIFLKTNIVCHDSDQTSVNDTSRGPRHSTTAPTIFKPSLLRMAVHYISIEVCGMYWRLTPTLTLSLTHERLSCNTLARISNGPVSDAWELSFSTSPRIEMHKRSAAAYICRSCQHARSHVALQRPRVVSKDQIRTEKRVYSTRPRPLHLAIIGSGPAGFYSAYRLLKSLPNARVDMYEGLPSPYGLVRFGIAPDHPEAKVRLRHCEPKHSRGVVA